MTRLIDSASADAKDVRLDIWDFDVIAREDALIGARVERWQTAHRLKRNAAPDEILAGYAPAIERSKRERGRPAADVVGVKPNNPNWPALRQNSVEEHTHPDDEVRNVVEGSGAFAIRTGGRVLQVIGEAGYLPSVPKGTPKWFDDGEVDDFARIRDLPDPAGWAAQYAGDGIWRAFPLYGEAA